MPDSSSGSGTWEGGGPWVGGLEGSPVILPNPMIWIRGMVIVAGDTMFRNRDLILMIGYRI